MIRKQTIVNLVVVVVLAAIVIAAGVAGSRRAADPVCSKITITIKDSVERQYVTVAELQQQLSQAGLWQVGLPLSKIHTQQIERCLHTHPMLRQVECYERTNGEVCITVSQRRPIVLIAGDEHYYLDTERQIMPVRASINTPVVVVSGRIGKQMAQTEMYDFVKWLNTNRFWREKIHSVRVITPKMVELIDDTHKYTIILGALNGAQQKLNNLQKLYEKGFDGIGYPEYKQIDLQFNNQIIGRK